VEGFVVSNIYLGTASNPDNGCNDISLSSGVAVSYCKQQDDYWYKFHLKHGKWCCPNISSGHSHDTSLAPTDSCKGATVEYYDDAACNSFAGISELDSYEAQCVESALVSDHKVYQSLLCSKAAEPPVPPNSYLIK
jgi:hypothetical protein